MQDAILHYMRINFATQGLTGKPAQRGGSKVPGVNNAPHGPVSVQARRPERLRLHHDQPRQPRSLGPPAETDRPRGPDRRSPLRHAGGPRGARARGGCRSSPTGRGTAPSTRRCTGRRRRHPGRRGARHDGTAERSELRAARHHADDAPPDPRRLQDAGLAGAGGRQAVEAVSRPRCWASTRPKCCARGWA